MTEREYHDEEFVVRMTPSQKRALTAAAGITGEPLAVFVRTAVQQRIEEIFRGDQ